MKYLLILFLLSPLSADYLYQGDNTCIHSLIPNADKGWCFIDTLSGSNFCEKNSDIDDFIAGYTYDSGSCVLKHDLQITGMIETQWQTLMIVLANVFGLIMLGSISYFIQRI